MPQRYHASCFVICPLGDIGSPERERSDRLFKLIIEPVCKSAGLYAFRADMMKSPTPITRDIFAALQKSFIVIADITDHNPNVFFERGYRAAFAYPCIQLAEDGTSLPFDVKDKRTIFYNLSDPDRIAKTQSDIADAIRSIAQHVSVMDRI